MNIKENDWKIWLIRSTFGIDNYESDYKLPKNICQFVKMFFVSILSIPFAWMSHLVNICTKKTDLHAGIGCLLLFIGMVANTVFVCSENNPITYFDDFSGLQKLLLIYACAPLGVLALALLIAAVACVVLVPCHFYDKWKKKRKEKQRKAEWIDQSEKPDSWITSFIKGLKNKYCVSITYVSDKKETKNN